MGAYLLSNEDLVRARQTLYRLLDRVRNLTEARQHAEEVMTQCHPESYGWAYWQYVLSLLDERPAPAESGYEPDEGDRTATDATVDLYTREQSRSN